MMLHDALLAQSTDAYLLYFMKVLILVFEPHLTVKEDYSQLFVEVTLVILRGP